MLYGVNAWIRIDDDHVCLTGKALEGNTAFLRFKDGAILGPSDCIGGNDPVLSMSDSYEVGGLPQRAMVAEKSSTK